VARAGTKNGTAHPHMGGPVGNGKFKVGTHTHAETRDAISMSDVRKHLEMRDRVLISRGNAHQTGNTKSELVPALRYKGISVSRAGAGLLRLFASIDLQEEVRIPALSRNFLGKSTCELQAIHRVNGIKQSDSIPHLVGLKRADEMNLRVRIGRLQIRPLALRFLNTVFTKNGLSCSEHRLNGVRWKGLAHRDQRDAVHLPAGIGRGSINLHTDGIKGCVASGGYWYAHGC